MATIERLLTAEEFLHLPHDGQLSELVRGRIVMMNMPGYQHGVICGRLVYFLTEFLVSHDLGTVLSNDSGVVTQRGPDSVRGADVAYYSYRRMPKHVYPRGYPAVAPELVFEVLSPDDRRSKVLEKVAEYLKAGVQTVSVVDPDDETVEVHLPTGTPTTLTSDQELTFPEILPGFSLSVRRIFD